MPHADPLFFHVVTHFGASLNSEWWRQRSWGNETNGWRSKSYTQLSYPVTPQEALGAGNAAKRQLPCFLQITLRGTARESTIGWSDHQSSPASVLLNFLKELDWDPRILDVPYRFVLASRVSQWGLFQRLSSVSGFSSFLFLRFWCMACILLHWWGRWPNVKISWHTQVPRSKAAFCSYSKDVLPKDTRGPWMPWISLQNITCTSVYAFFGESVSSIAL